MELADREQFLEALAETLAELKRFDSNRAMAFGHALDALDALDALGFVPAVPAVPHGVIPSETLTALFEPHLRLSS